MKLKFTSVIPIMILCISMSLISQNAGEIVFSKTMIDPVTPAGLTSEFQAGDPIYAVAFFDKNVSDLGRSPNASKVTIEVFLFELKPPLYDYQQPSEAQLEFGSLLVSGDAVQHAYLPLDIVPKPDAMTAYGSEELLYKKFGNKFDGPVKFAEALSKLETGKHTIIVKVKCNYNVVAEGRFIITGDDYAIYQNMSEEVNQSASNLKTKDLMMPKSARSDKQLEAEMIKAFKASQTYQDRVKGEVLRVVIIDPDWMIRRNQLTSVIMHRYIRAAIAVKNSDGICTLWQNVTFQQDYVSNEFQSTRFDGIGDPLKIPCENVNK